MKLISIVVPVFNEEKAIPIFFDSIYKTINNFDYDINFEIIFIDDGSRDSTLDILNILNTKHDIVKFISFSRNFGKESAIYAGLEHTYGDFIAVLDVDLQDPPNMLNEMYSNIINHNYDCVAVKRTSRKDEPKIRSFFAKKFYSIINKISKTEFVSGARDFRLMTRQMVDSILKLKEYNRFSKGIFSWVGFNTKWLEYENVKRCAGETKWSFFQLLLYSIDGILAFSTVPLFIASILGIVMFFISILYIIFIVYKTLVFGENIQGYPTIICLITLIGGLQLFCMGILGQYISKIYSETKNRPIYIIKYSSINKF